MPAVKTFNGICCLKTASLKQFLDNRNKINLQGARSATRRVWGIRKDFPVSQQILHVSMAMRCHTALKEDATLRQIRFLMKSRSHIIMQQFNVKFIFG
jgi:hypothetical protein